MNLGCAKKQIHGLTLIDVLFVIFFIAMLSVIILPRLATASRTNCKTTCAAYLKQINLGFEVWQGDNHGKYPAEVPAPLGGAMELAAAGDATAVFQVMSNELSTQKILICPIDKEHFAATNFGAAFTGKNLSYFCGLDANQDYPNSILAGDSNLERGGSAVASGLHEVTAPTMIYWSVARHNRTGNLALADGSVLGLTNPNLRTQFRLTGLTTNRIIIP